MNYNRPIKANLAKLEHARLSLRCATHTTTRLGSLDERLLDSKGCFIYRRLRFAVKPELIRRLLLSELITRPPVALWAEWAEGFEQKISSDSQTSGNF